MVCAENMGRMKNPHFPKMYPTWRHFLRWKLGFYDESYQEPIVPLDFIYPAELTEFNQSEPYGLWVGHSSFLLSVNQLHFLTDPVWSSHCSPIPFKMFKRILPPPISLSNLPSIDCVLISHNHYDHLDAKTVVALHAQYPFLQWIVPKHLSSWFNKRNITNVVELDWWETFSSQRFTVTAVPAQHFSGRSLWDKNQTGWNGYVVKTQDKTFYFAGDTGYNPIDFKEIGKKQGPMDLSLIPIGVYSPRAFMAPVHVHPEESVQIHEDVGSLFSVGMHWKTFCLSEEGASQPPYDLFLAMREKNLPFSSFVPVNVGHYFNW